MIIEEGLSPTSDDDHDSIDKVCSIAEARVIPQRLTLPSIMITSICILRNSMLQSPVIATTTGTVTVIAMEMVMTTATSA